MEYRYIIYFDASAAVRLVMHEPGSDNVRPHFAEHFRHYMTSLCFAEALGVLKRKMDRKQLSRDQYFDACFLLMSYLKEGRLHLDDTINISLETFMQAETLARKYEIDLSDALQIITVKHGSFKNLACESKTVLATGDSGLAKAAEQEGLRVWNCEKSPIPP